MVRYGRVASVQPMKVSFGCCLRATPHAWYSVTATPTCHDQRSRREESFHQSNFKAGRAVSLCSSYFLLLFCVICQRHHLIPSLLQLIIIHHRGPCGGKVPEGLVARKQVHEGVGMTSTNGRRNTPAITLRKRGPALPAPGGEKHGEQALVTAGVNEAGHKRQRGRPQVRYPVGSLHRVLR